MANTTSALFNTADRIIRFAMKDALILQDGQDPNGEQYADWFTALQDLINFYQTEGKKLFLLEDTSIALIAGTAKYVLATGNRIEMGYYLDSSNNSRPIYPLAWSDYLRLANRTQQGSIINYFADRQPTSLNVTFYQVPDTEAATGTAHVLLRTQAQSLVTLTDAMLFPPEWFNALHWGLAAQKCHSAPAQVQARCEKWGQYFKQKLEDWDVENTPVTMKMSGLNIMARRFK